MKYRLKSGSSSNMKIHACEYYSTNYLMVEKDERYQFNVDPDDLWEDWIFNKSADGFFNLFLLNKKKRVKGQNCFKLCGSLSKNKKTEKVFPIGTELTWTAPFDGQLFFFANDHKNRFYYRNNKGSITLQVERLGI